MLKEEDSADQTGVEKSWIDGQINYYGGAIKEREKKLGHLELTESWLYRAGLALTFFTFISFLFYFFHADNSETYELLGHIFHTFLFLSGMFLVTAAFIGEKYVHMMGYREEIYYFEIIKRIFDKARKEMAENEFGDECYSGIIKKLGIEALNEITHWVVLHYDRNNKPSIE